MNAGLLNAMQKTFGLIGPLVLASALVSNVSHADGHEHGGQWYAAVDVVSVSFLHPETNNSNWQVVDEHDKGFVLAAGYRFKPNWYVEASYADLGQATLEHRNPVITGREHIEYKVPAILLQYRIDMNDDADWALFLRAGIARMRNSSSSENMPYEAQTATQYPVGMAMVVHPDKPWSMRLKVDGYDKDAISVGISLMRNFGL